MAFPFSRRFITSAASMAMAIPTTYMENAATAAQSGKNMSENSTYTGSLAEQDIKGVTNMVFRLSCSVSRALVAIMAGTVQPKPSIMGRKALPDNPTFPMTESIT